MAITNEDRHVLQRKCNFSALVILAGRTHRGEFREIYCVSLECAVAIWIGSHLFSEWMGFYFERSVAHVLHRKLSVQYCSLWYLARLTAPIAFASLIISRKKWFDLLILLVRIWSSSFELDFGGSQFRWWLDKSTELTSISSSNFSASFNWLFSLFYLKRTSSSRLLSPE